MAGTIKVDTAAFLVEAKSLSEALEPFKSYATTSSEGYLASIEGFNSDFIEVLKAILRRINDDAGPELLATIEEHQRRVAALADTFAEADDDIAAGVTGGS